MARLRVGKLTAREVDILILISCGATSKEIARGLYLSDSTVEKHLLSIRNKLDARTTPHAVALFLKEELASGVRVD